MSSLLASLLLPPPTPTVDEQLGGRDSEGAPEDTLEIETARCCTPPTPPPFDAPVSLNRGLLMQTPRAADESALAAHFLRSASASAACACARFDASIFPAADAGASAPPLPAAAAAAIVVVLGAADGARTPLAAVASLWPPTPWPAPSEAPAAPVPPPSSCVGFGLATAPFSFLYSLYLVSIPAATMSSTAGLRPPLAALNDFSQAVISPLTDSRSLRVSESIVSGIREQWFGFRPRTRNKPKKSGYGKPASV